MAIEPAGAQLTIADGVRTFARALADRDAVVDGDRRLSFAALGERSDRVAAGLLAAGVLPGQRVALHLGNRLEVPELAAGVAKAGMVMVPLDPRLTPDELTRVLDLADVRAVVLDTAVAGSLGPVVDRREMAAVWELDGTELGDDYAGVLRAARAVDPRIAVDETSPFGLFATSGTTGTPKGVQISHRSRSLTFSVAALEWGLGPGARTMAVAPMSHGAGFTFGYGAIACGATAVLHRRFEPEAALAQLAAERVTSVFLVPTHLQLLRELGADAVAGTDLAALSTVFVNAAAMPYELKRWLLDVLPEIGLHEIYGSTEAGVVACLRPEDQLRKPGSVGPPWFHTEVRLLPAEHDPARAALEAPPVAPGQPGVLYSRSPYLMVGYLDDDEATAACTTPDGFLTAGDVASIDEEGYLSIVDRITDAIVTGGINVYPREIEDVLVGHPDVAGAAVVGVSDERYGEAIAALLVPRAGAVDTTEVRRFCQQRLAGFKVPTRIELAPSLPMSSAGKVLKREVRDRFSRASLGDGAA